MDSGARDARRFTAGSQAPAAGAGGISDRPETQSQSLQRTLCRSPRARRSRQAERRERILRAVGENLRGRKLDTARAEPRARVTGEEVTPSNLSFLSRRRIPTRLG